MSRLRFTLCALTLLVAAWTGGVAASCEWCGPPAIVPTVVTTGYYPYTPNFCCGAPVRPIAYACPTPAPPSGSTFGTPEPPPTGKQPLRQGPIIQQYRSFNGVPQIVEPRTAMCKVSFWNLTPNDVTLFVGNDPHRLQKDRAVVLDLNRQFSWRTDNTNQKTEDVPDDANHFEVVIR